MNFKEIIDKILKTQISAWNEKDFSNLEKYFSEDLVHSSPNVFKVYPERTSSVIRGRAEMFDYLEKLSNLQPFQIEIVEITKRGHHSQAILKLKELNQKMQADYILDEYGKVIKITFTQID